MGMFESLFGWLRRPRGSSTWQTLTGYRAAWTDWKGELYESELIRAAIDTRARAAAKLEPNFVGTAQAKLRARTRGGPNAYQTWSQFFYRASTILDARNTCFLCPVLDETGATVGLIAVNPLSYELKADETGTPWLRFTFGKGDVAAIELSRTGILTRHQYRDDLFGESNGALNATMQLLDMQRQGITEGIKNSATFRFMARLKNFSRHEDLKKERLRFNEQQLKDGDGGILLVPNTYEDVKQIEQRPYTVDADQLKLIQTNVYNYFGVNEDVLQNKAIGDVWSAFYEGCVEVFAIQASEVITRMLYSEREIAGGNRFFLSANRTQYMVNRDKLQLVRDASDRGLMFVDEIREILNMPPLPNGLGQRLPTRGEYYDAAKPPEDKVGPADQEKEEETDADEEADQPDLSNRRAIHIAHKPISCRYASYSAWLQWMK